MDSFHRNAALVLSHGSCAGTPVGIGDSAQDILIRNLPALLFLPLLQHLIDDLALFETAVADGGQDRIPVPESISVHHLFHKFRFPKLCPVDSLGLAVALDHLLAPDDIVLFHLGLKPLVDLCLSLGALYNLQPIPAGPLGILGSDNLDLVAVLNHIFDGNQLSVHPCAHHLIAHRAVDGVGKINGGRTAGKGFHIPRRGKAVHAVREQIQISLNHA